MAKEVVTIENLGEFKDKIESNIKTINGQTLIGSGNIAIAGDVTKAYVDNKVDNLEARLEDEIEAKQDKLTAGDNITIEPAGAVYKEITSNYTPISFYATSGNMQDYTLYGTFSQEGTPSLESPVDVNGLGADIGVLRNGENIANIYLQSPLYTINERTDYLSFNEGKAHRFSKKVDLATLSWTAELSSGRYRFYTLLPDYTPSVSAGRDTKVYLNRFYYSAQDAYGVGFGHSNGRLYIYVSADVTNTTQLLSWLSSHPSYVVYPTAEYLEYANTPYLSTTSGQNTFSFSPRDPSKVYFKYIESSSSDIIISGKSWTSEINAKQDVLVSGETIKTINGNSLLGSGNIEIQGGSGGSYTAGDGIVIENNVISTDSQELTQAQTDALNSGINSTKVATFTNKQDKLVSGTNIKTINSTSLLGSGNVSVQATLVSGSNIKTINGNSLLGSGNIALQTSIEHDSTLDGAGTSSSLLSVNSTSIVGDDPQTISYNSEDSKVHLGIDIDKLKWLLGVDETTLFETTEATTSGTLSEDYSNFKFLDFYVGAKNATQDSIKIIRCSTDGRPTNFLYESGGGANGYINFNYLTWTNNTYFNVTKSKTIKIPLTTTDIQGVVNETTSVIANCIYKVVGIHRNTYGG